jgi:type VI secretion system protein ImpL
MSLLRKTFGWLVHRWVLSVLGLLIIALLIWLFGPEVAIAGRVPLASEVNRLIAILALVLVWAAIVVTSALRQRRTNEAVVDGLMRQVAQPVEDPSAAMSREEARKLDERFRDALSTLRQMRLGRRRDRRYLYQLPWYVIIGAPGSGKTTALANSGLKFPLSDKMGELAVRGVGGTRNCDWFFTDGAVLIDTAGRYTTQDSDEAVDRSAWQSFLELLRKYRPRRPIEGILIAFSIADLAQSDLRQRLAHARAIKRRIQEIYGALKLRAPVYVLFTKCDLIAGFTDFFHSLSAEERRQVWGTTFSLSESRDIAALLRSFPGEFERLVERLSARVIACLEEEPDVSRRAILLSFPQQMTLLGPALNEFLSETFGQSRFEDPLMLRGVYFTSATQEGTPIDRVIGAVARAFRMQPRAMPAFSGRGSSFFLTRLLKEVVFAESGLVASTNFFDRHRASVLWAAYGGAAALAALALAGISVSYFGNRALVDEAGGDVDALAQAHGPALSGRGNLAAILAALDALRNLPDGYAERGEGAPVLLTSGLYQGNKLGDAAQDTYRRALNRLLVPVLMRRLEQQVADNATNTELSYQALKVYLMFTMPERRDADFMKLWIGSDWNDRYSGAENAPFRERFSGHLAALLESPIEPTPAGNAVFVGRTRQTLLRLPPGARTYSELRAENVGAQSDEWTLAAHVEPKDLAFFRRRSGKPMTDGIPAFHTVDGYRAHFIDKRGELVGAAGRDPWVLGPDLARFQTGETGAQIVRKVEELYLSDYIRLWDGLLNDLELVTPMNVEQLADMLRAVAQPNSPVKTVLGSIASQTQLAGALRAAERERQLAATGELEKLKSQVNKFVTPGQPAAPSADPTERVDAYFRPLIRLVSEDGGQAPIDAALRPLGELYNYIVQTQQAGADPKQALDAFMNTFPKATALATQLQSTARVQPEPIRRWLTGVANTVTASAVAPKQAEAARRVQDVWRTSVAPACEEALDGRYPFVPGSTTDANLIDFARVLGPNGLIEQFSKTYIEPFADTSVQPWRWIDPKAGGLRMSTSSLAMFERAARIRQAFFAAGMPQPQVFFEVEPLSLNNRARQVQLDLGNQSLVYQHGPRRPMRLQWPPTAGSSASILFTPVDNPNTNVGLTKGGPWALFRLVGAGQATRSGGVDRFRLSFDVEDYNAEFELRAESVINPLYLPELQEFRCLSTL